MPSSSQSLRTILEAAQLAQAAYADLDDVSWVTTADDLQGILSLRAVRERCQRQRPYMCRRISASFIISPTHRPDTPQRYSDGGQCRPAMTRAVSCSPFVGQS